MIWVLSDDRRKSERTSELYTQGTLHLKNQDRCNGYDVWHLFPSRRLMRRRSTYAL